MKINDSQYEFLGSLQCVRLSSDEAHKETISLIENTRNPGLVSYLHEKGWSEDLDGSTAFYIIKDSKGNTLLFFSLKCGALFQHLDEEQIKQQKQFLELAKHIIQSPSNEEEREIASLILDKFRSNGIISEDEAKVLMTVKIAKNKKKYNAILKALDSDKERDPNEHIIRVASTHSGIELVHLCANERCKHLWPKHLFPHSLGKVMFWKFIIPIVEDVRKLVGCKYLFLFAADNTVDLTLVNYYQVDLHLDRPNHIGTSKPQYDFNCVFMCQDIDKMVQKRHEFFNNFNPDLSEMI